jgi:hypothetical protein
MLCSGLTIAASDRIAFSVLAARGGMHLEKRSERVALLRQIKARKLLGD